MSSLKNIIYFFICLIFIVVFSLSPCNVYAMFTGRLEGSANYYSFDYSEDRGRDNPSNINFTEKGVGTHIEYQQALFTEYLYFLGSIDYLATPFGVSDDQHKVRFLDSSGALYLTFPGARPVNISISAESFFTKLDNIAGDYQFDSESGLAFNGMFDLTATWATVYAKIPLITAVGERNIFGGGVKFRINTKEVLKYPDSMYVGGTVLRFDYSINRFTVQDDLTNEETNVKIKMFSASLGYAF